MKNRKKKKKILGFTVIEIMIVLAIAGLIMLIVFIAVPTVQKGRRDAQRRSYAGQVFAAMGEYYKNNGHYLDPSNGSDWARFLVVYMPDGSDPVTGESYKMANVDDVEWVSHGQTNPQHSVVILDEGVPHNDAQPGEGQVVVATGHTCQGAHPDDSGNVLSDVAYDKAHIRDVFAVVVYQERGQYYCIDNYEG